MRGRVSVRRTHTDRWTDNHAPTFVQRPMHYVYAMRAQARPCHSISCRRLLSPKCLASKFNVFGSTNSFGLPFLSPPSSAAPGWESLRSPWEADGPRNKPLSLSLPLSLPGTKDLRGNPTEPLSYGSVEETGDPTTTGWMVQGSILLASQCKCD